ncbi:carbohydrate ABC transporter permease [Natrarchaeobius oligotrophus]|uniref:sn-glycerol-3-phosphate transport system permease protein UgpA n=1 Tax=Natrarchaeobius chitinivorans TaxID=1679083 RepID=A0A3N6M6G1_NATCH|nr:sugar ABC transporter permease [Natrarchaeobius chitinivorans]RQG99173.1 sugar ABC transporter permease [Natrarchaeobius chitinivorans]
MAAKEPFASRWQAAALLAPLLAVITFLVYYPGLELFRLSLYRVSTIGGGETFVGLDNFAYLASSSTFRNSLMVSFLFAALVIFGTIVVSFAISYLIYITSFGKGAYLIAVVWPYALPPAVAGSILLFLAHPSTGVITHFLGLFGINLSWLSVGWQGMLVVATAAIWKQIGYNVIFIVAALNNVPETLTETTRLDGVGTHSLIAKVYAPLIAPTLLFLVVMNTMYSFYLTFPLIDLMTQGAPGGATNILIYKIYRDAFEFGSMGLAAAESVILFVIVALAMYIQFAWSDKRIHYGS